MLHRSMERMMTPQKHHQANGKDQQEAKEATQDPASICCHFQKNSMKNLILGILTAKLVPLALISACGMLFSPFMQDALLFVGKDLAAEIPFHLVNGFIRWDALHYLHIARNGYTQEMQYAFLPGLPWLIRKFSTNPRSSLALIYSGLIACNVAHILACLVLHQLTLELFGSKRFAILSSLIFAWNPAMAYLSSIYTEPIFALLSFTGMLLFYRQSFHFAAIVWTAASCLRANGFLLAGFFWFRVLDEDGDFFGSAIYYTGMMLAPFLRHLYSGYKQFCSESPKDMPEWCHATWNIYSYVQKRHWNVGLGLYWTFGNIPNFMIATPMSLLCICCIYQLWESLGADMFVLFGSKKRVPLKLSHSNHSLASLHKHRRFLSHRLLIPHVHLLTFMLVYTLACANVQIVTRLFTGMPLPYWYLAYTTIANIPKKLKSQEERNGDSWLWFFPLAFFIGYGLVNCVLFAAFLPPA